MNITVEFIQGARVEFNGLKKYNPGEQAGFPKDMAMNLIANGVARRVRGAQQPLIAAALNIPDPQIQRQAQALEKLGHLEDREAQQARLRADIAAIEKQEARALALGDTLPAGTAEQKRLLVEQLLKVEKEIHILTEQYEPLFIELQQAVHGYIKRAFAEALTASIAPPMRALVSLVGKADRIFDGVAAGVRTLDELRSLGQVVELEDSGLNTMLSDVIQQIVGADTLTSPITGQTSISNLAVILHGIAAAQERAKARA